MSNKKQAEEKFKRKVAERDALVAEGLESYPLRLYECVVCGYETGKGAFTLKPHLFTISMYESEEDAKKHIKLDIERGFEMKKHCYAQCGRKIRMTGVDFKLIREA